MTSPDAADARGWRDAWIVTTLAALVRLGFAAWLPLFPDETYYWDWSRHLAGGYFDHPPMIAVLVRMGTALAEVLGQGPTPLSVRFFPVVAGFVASLAAAAIARRLAGGEAARLAAIVFALMPLAASGLVLATPDAPLLAASACGLYAVVRAFQAAPASRESLGWWTLAGAFLGVAFASKYTSILLPLSITVAVLVRPSLRGRLREPGPWIACVVATLVFLPVLRWNAAHDWISFRFQLQHGLGTPSGSAVAREFDLLGGQLGLVSPIIFALMAVAVWGTMRRAQDDPRFALAVVAVGSWVFFAWSAMRRRVEANWPAPSYIPGVALLSAMAVVDDRWRRWLRRGIALAALMVAVIYLDAIVPILPLPARRDPLARNAGWSELARTVQAARDRSVARTWVGADRYQDASELAFHLRDHPFALCMCIGGRHNQYELWPAFSQRAARGDALVLALDDTPDVHVTAARLAPYFASVERGAVSPLMRGSDTVSVRRVWTLRGYRGGWPPRDER